MVAALTIVSVALSIALLLSVEKLRRDTKASFSNTVSGIDLIVGARTGSIQLLLYSVFRIGNATNNISYQSYQEIAQDDAVAWTIPMSLGDSHRGYRVLGTTTEYFDKFRYARDQKLELTHGTVFQTPLQAVLGAEVARQLDYEVGEEIVLAHGAGEINLVQHDDKPFTVVGVLGPTGTPVDRTVHVSLHGIAVIHDGWQDGSTALSIEEFEKTNESPEAITAFMVRLKSRTAIFRTQRFINEFAAEPLQAILPGVALQELWDMMGIAETALRVVAIMVVATGIIGMLVVVLASLEARRREMAILRSVGARASHIFLLLVAEAGLLSAIGVAVGVVLFYLGIILVRPFTQSLLGVDITVSLPTTSDLLILFTVIVAGLLAGLVPALRAYRRSLSDGLSIRF